MTRIYPNLSYLADENGRLRIELLPINDTGASQTELWSAYKTYARIQELQLEVDAISGGGAGVGISDGTISVSTTWSSTKINTELLFKEDPANKNQIEGYPGLDEFGLILLSVIPNIPTTRITGFDVAVNNNTLVTANTAKVTNATHTGDVTGSYVLTISSNAVTLDKLVDFSESTILGRASTGVGDPEILTATQTRNLLNVQDGATANNTNAFLLSRYNHTGTQAATTVSYDNTLSGLTATDVQTAIDELGTDLVIGVDVQAYSAELDAIAQLNSATNTLFYFTGVGTAGVTPFTSFARTLLDDTDALTVRTTIGLENVDNISDANKPVSIATQSVLDGKQPLNGDLTALSGVTSLADTLFYFTGSQTGSVTTLTPFARTLLDDIDATTVRTTLGLGTSSILDSGVANGVATLDGGGKIPTSQLPSSVDEIIESTDFASLPVTGEDSKIYVTLDNNLTYRWSGSAYVEISASLALGTTSSTAYRGDYSEIAYTHSQAITGNPHAVTPTDLGLGNVDNTSDLNKPVSTATQSALDLKQPLDAELTALSGLTSAVDSLPYFTGIGTAALTTLSSAGRALIDDADVAAQLATLGVTNVVLGATAGYRTEYLTQAAYDAIVTKDPNTQYLITDAVLSVADVSGISVFGSSLIDDANAATARTTLGLENVNNTSDADKPIGTAAQSALNLKAPLANPTFTGIVQAPTFKTTGGSGDEGGQIDFAVAPNGSLSYFAIDLHIDSFRLISNDGAVKTYSLDLTQPSANILTSNDIEEGTFVPALTGFAPSFEPPYSIKEGGYIKIGKKVSIWITIFTTSSIPNGSGPLIIRNLPFPTKSGNYRAVGSGMHANLNGISAGAHIPWVNAGSSVIELLTPTNQMIMATSVGFESYLAINLEYFTD